MVKFEHGGTYTLHSSIGQQVQLVEVVGQVYQPVNVFFGGVCIGQFLPNSERSAWLLSQAIDPDKNLEK